MKILFVWEKIYEGSYDGTERAKVIGGWLVKHIELNTSNTDGNASMVFVPDAKHEWKIK